MRNVVRVFPLEERVCGCGCGRTFKPTCQRQKYMTMGCVLRVKRAAALKAQEKRLKSVGPTA